MRHKELNLFDLEECQQVAKPKKTKGGSANSIIFHDYESFVAKFKDNPKTTDDTFTPQDVYEAVVKYVGTVVDLSDMVICRPFFPGGDYENAYYPDNGIVIDNPPFSIFTKICAFYTVRKIPFFLFGPGLTISSCCKYCTAVIIENQIEFQNGAKVKCNFASNLFGDTLVMTAPKLAKLIRKCPSQNTKVNLTKYVYPDELLSISDMQTIAGGNISFSVSRHEAVIISGLDNHPNGKGALFGDHFLVEPNKAAAKAAAKAAIHIELSAREKRIIKELQEHE